MKISFKTDYALKVILDLALNYPDQLGHIKEISARRDIPAKFLEQILLELKRAGFVQSKKGPNGGYSLARAPEEIFLGEVVRFIEGAVYPISCIDPALKQPCNDACKCVFLPVWDQVNEAISAIIDRVNFLELKERYLKVQEMEAIHYNI